MRFHRIQRTHESLLGRLLSPIVGHDGSSHVDYTLLIVLCIILFFGLLMLSSATSVLSFERTHNSYTFFKQQLTHGIIPGLLLFFIALRIPYRRYEKIALYLFWLTVGLLLLVFIPHLGVRFNGVTSWIHVAGITVQTSELAKPFFIVWLAAWLAQRNSAMSDLRSVTIPFALQVGFICLLLMLQPDMGTMVIFATIAFLLFIAANARLTHILGFIGIGAALGTLLIFSAPYRLQRLLTFWNPGGDLQGSGYQLNQSLIAIGSGGLFGLGVGNSRQKFDYVPEIANDSIFAIISEEWGFIFSALLIILFLTVFWRGILIARHAPDRFGGLLAFGIASMIAIQTLINIGAMLGLVPLTGIPLPFISLGGTNVAVLLASIGVLANISKYSVAK